MPITNQEREQLAVAFREERQRAQQEHGQAWDVADAMAAVDRVLSKSASR